MGFLAPFLVENISNTISYNVLIRKMLKELISPNPRGILGECARRLEVFGIRRREACLRTVGVDESMCLSSL